MVQGDPYSVTIGNPWIFFFFPQGAKWSSFPLRTCRKRGKPTEEVKRWAKWPDLAALLQEETLGLGRVCRGVEEAKATLTPWFHPCTVGQKMAPSPEVGSWVKVSGCNADLETPFVLKDTCLSLGLPQSRP